MSNIGCVLQENYVFEGNSSVPARIMNKILKPNMKTRKKEINTNHFPPVLLPRPNMSGDNNELEDAREDKDHTHLLKQT